MKFKFLMSAMLATAFCSTPTWAGHFSNANQGSVVPDKMTGPKTSKFDITLTLAPGAGGPGTAGPCSGGEGFADFCPGGTCTCYTYTGTVKGSAGSGVFAFFETYDRNEGYDEGTTAVTPAYGDLEIAGSKDTESIIFEGADFGAEFVFSGFLAGGCIIAETGVFLGGAEATCTGSYNEDSKTTFSIKGVGLK